MSRKEDVVDLKTPEGQKALDELLKGRQYPPSSFWPREASGPPRSRVVTSNEQVREKYKQLLAQVAEDVRRGMLNREIGQKYGKNGAGLVRRARAAGYDIPTVDERRQNYWQRPGSRQQAREARRKRMPQQ